MFGGGGETIDSGVRGGRNSGGLGYMSHSVFKVCLPLKFREKHESCPKEGLEKFSGDTPFKEAAELSQHEKLQDPKLHDGKAV